MELGSYFLFLQEQIKDIIIVIKAEWRLVARCSDEATRCSEGAAQRHSLGTCHSKGAAVVLEEDAVTMKKFFFVRLISKGLKIINCLFVGEEEEQLQELTKDASRGSHTRRQESHLPVSAIWVAIVANLVSSGSLKDFIRIVGIAKLTLILPIVASANKVVTQGDVHEQIDLLRYSDVEDFKIGMVITRLCLVA
jgi:hypothetical protein